MLRENRKCSRLCDTEALPGLQSVFLLEEVVDGRPYDYAKRLHREEEHGKVTTKVRQQRRDSGRGSCYMGEVFYPAAKGQKRAHWIKFLPDTTNVWKATTRGEGELCQNTSFMDLRENQYGRQ